MTARKLYLFAKRVLNKAGIEAPEVEASLLCRHFLGLDRIALAIHGDEAVDFNVEQELMEAVYQRAERRPLQYILGSWEFMGLSLRVGEGVLTPREDTAVLVKAVAERLKGAAAPRGVDLCAGTGAVGLGICSLIPDARVACVELDETAGRYLAKNLRTYPQYRTESMMGDVLSRDTARRLPDGLEFVVSNPPYIASAELPVLQEEVRREPQLALDGGEDGLKFYRAIGEIWAEKLAPSGILGVEIGEDQAAEVEGIFKCAGMENIEVRKDLAGLDRVVIGQRPNG